MLPDFHVHAGLHFATSLWLVGTGIGLALLVLAGTLIWSGRQRRVPQEAISASAGGAFLMGLASLSRVPSGRISQRASAGSQLAYSTVLTSWAHDEYGIDLTVDGATRLALQHDPIIAVRGRFMRVSLGLRDDGALMLVNPLGDELETRVR